jgi:hypothetical protein
MWQAYGHATAVPDAPPTTAFHAKQQCQPIGLCATALREMGQRPSTLGLVHLEDESESVPGTDPQGLLLHRCPWH